MDVGVEISDVVYQTEDRDNLYSAYYSEPLDTSHYNNGTNNK